MTDDQVGTTTAVPKIHLAQSISPSDSRPPAAAAPPLPTRPTAATHVPMNGAATPAGAGPGGPGATGRPEPVGRRRLTARFHAMRTVERYLLVGLWAVLIAIFGFARPDSFLRLTTAQAIFGNSSVYVLLGLAALCTAAVAEIDLSVAFITGLSATLVPLLVSEHGFNVVVASVVAVAVGALCGMVNAIIIVTLRVDALIATLGFGTVLLGLAQTLSHQTTVSGIPPSFTKVSVTHVVGLPLVFWYGIVLALFIGYVMAYTPLGRNMAFVGANREVARLAGIRVNRIRFGAYTAGGVIAGVAGVLLASQLGGFDPSSSSSYLLPTFAVVFLSASVVRPGRFNAIGVVIGAYFIATGTLGLELLGYSGPAENIFYGGALVGAVAVVTLVQRRSAAGP